MIFVYFFYLKKKKEGLEDTPITTEDEDTRIENFNTMIKTVIHNKLDETDDDTIKEYVSVIYDFIKKNTETDENTNTSNVNNKSKVETIYNTLIRGQYDSYTIRSWEDSYIYFLKNYISGFYNSLNLDVVNKNEDGTAVSRESKIFLNEDFKETFKVFISFKLLTVSLLYYILNIILKEHLDILQGNSVSANNLERDDEIEENVKSIGEILGLFGLLDVSTINDNTNQSQTSKFINIYFVMLFIKYLDDNRLNLLEFQEDVFVNNDYSILKYISQNNLSDITNGNKDIMFNKIIKNNLYLCENLIEKNNNNGLIIKIKNFVEKDENDNFNISINILKFLNDTKLSTRVKETKIDINYLNKLFIT